MLLRLKIGLSSSEFVQHDQRSARNLTVTARMPEDRSNTVKHIENLQQPLKTCKAIYTCMCTPVGPTEESLPR
eukprot:13062999-Heterocapsa_arctica.AAC.1